MVRTVAGGGIGYRLWVPFAGGPRILLSSAVVAETAAIGTLVGTFSVENGSGTYTFTLTDDAGGVFALDGADLETAAALDFETTAVYTVTVEADNGVDDPLSRSFSIVVSDVAEGATGLETAFKRRMAAGLSAQGLMGPTPTPDASPGVEWRKSVGCSYDVAAPTTGGLTSALRRRMSAGLSAQGLQGPALAPDASQPAAWRAQVGCNYIPGA